MSFDGDRLQRYEAEYRRRILTATVTALALHAALIISIERTSQWQTLPEERIRLGYEGPTRLQRELEVLVPNSVQAHFSQLAREGRTSAVEYHILPELEITHGPATIPVPEVKPRPEAQPSVQAESEIEVEPLIATHAEISYSEDFVILRLVKPVYPEYELERDITASITVAAWLTSTGELQDVQITQAIAEPPSASTRGFEIASLEAIRQWKIRPPRRLQETSGLWLTIPIRFDPRDDDFLGPQGVKTP
jgi:TonB family protein